VCILGLAATSHDDGIDALLEYNTVRCMWAPAAMSLCARFLWSPLPEVLGLAMLICLGEAPRCVLLETQVPAPGRLERWDRQSGGKFLAAHTNSKVEK
jgi:hypothetical protein